MVENGPVRIYKIRPLYDFYPDITLPTCMYKINNIFLNDHSSNQSIKGDNIIEIEKVQQNILQKLQDLKTEVLQMKECLDFNKKEEPKKIHEIVVKANPHFPPYSIWILQQLLSSSMAIRLSTHVHSSLLSIPDCIKELQENLGPESYEFSLRVIWKETSKDHEMMVNPIHQGIIEGEVNIARYISRIANFDYESDSIQATQIDDWLEIVHSSIIHGNNKERQGALHNLNDYLDKNDFLVGKNLTLADIVMWSAIVQTNLYSNLPTNIKKWYQMLNNDIFSMYKEINWQKFS